MTVLERKAVGSNLEKFFFEMGARVKMVEVAPVASGWRRVDSRGEDLGVVLDIRRTNEDPSSKFAFWPVRITSFWYSCSAQEKAFVIA